MPEGPARKAPARKQAPRKAAAPRTKGTPKSPPKPRKVAAAAKPRAKAGRAPARREASPALAWTEVAPPVPPAGDPAPPRWTLAPAPAPARPFDPATGAWLPAQAPAVAQEPTADPAAYRRGATRSILLNVLLGLVLAFLAFEFLGQLVAGLVLYFAPDSATADRLEKALDGDLSPGIIIANSLLTFTLMGVIPFLWVLGTRVRAWPGTVRFLQLRVGWKDIARGVALVPVMLLTVYALLVVWTCAVHGCDALAKDDGGQDSPMQSLLENLTWPVVIVVAACAGIGEELFFRGVLRRWLGVWGQAVAFGLAHAVNAYPPQVLFAFGMGVAFGYLHKRGWSLVTLMIAHALYDFTLLAAALLVPGFG